MCAYGIHSLCFSGQQVAHDFPTGRPLFKFQALRLPAYPLQRRYYGVDGSLSNRRWVLGEIRFSIVKFSPKADHSQLLENNWQ